MTNENLPTLVSPNQFDLWQALRDGNPDLVQAPIENPGALVRFDDFPGFRPWLISQYALGWQSKRIVEHLRSIREEQENDLARQWPDLGKREIDSYRSVWRDDWMPVQAKLSQNIENVSVLSKNRRLLDLARVASEIEDQMWTERNSKSGQLYLIGEYRAILRQIAEEKGELGEEGSTSDNTLVTLANLLSNAVKIQGAGLQQRNVVLENDYDYGENDHAQTTVQREGRDFQADEVPPDAGADSVSQD